MKKKIMACILASLITHTVSAQSDVEIISGKPIGGKYELTTFIGGFEPFVLNYFMMLDYKTQYLGNALGVDHYFISTSWQAGIFGVNEDLEITHSLIIDSHQSLNESFFLEAVLFNEQILLFFESKEEKKTRSLYYQAADLYDMKIAEPVFLDQYETNKHLELHLKKSPDGNLLTILVNPNTTVKKSRFFHLIQLNKSRGEVLKLTDQDATFTTAHNFDQWAVSTTGEVTLIYGHNAGIYSPGGIEKPGESIGLVTVKKDTVKKQLITLPDRKILDCSVMPGTQNDQLFISWYYVNDYHRSGFSSYDLTGNGETPVIDFEPNWAEPFTQLSGNYYRDQAVCYQPSMRFMNAAYSLVDVIHQDNWTTYLVEKKTDLRFYAADYGKTILAIDNSNTTTTYNSDLFLVRVNETGEMTEAAKIERGLFHGIFPGNVLTFQDGEKMHILYCTLENTNYAEVSDNYKGIASNYEVNIAEVDLAGSEINLSKRTINQFNESEKMTQFVPFLQTASGEIDNFTTLAFTEEGFRMLRVVY